MRPSRSVVAGLRSLLERPVLLIVLVAATARIVAALALGLQPGYAIPDEEQYVIIADLVASGESAAEYGRQGYGQRLYDTTYPFSATLAALFGVFGTHQMVGQLLSAFFGVVAAALTTSLALRVVRAPWAVLAGLVAALLPSQVLWSSVVLRESMVWTALVALALAVTAAARLRSPWALAGTAATAGASLLTLGLLREQTMVIAGLALALAVFVIKMVHPTPVRIAAVALAALVPVAAGHGVFGIAVVERYAPQLATVRLKLSIGADSSFIDRGSSQQRPAQDLPGSPGPGAGEPSATGGASGEDPGAPPGSTSSTPDDALPEDPSKDVVAARDGRVYEVDNSAGGLLESLPRGLVAVTLRPFPWEPASNSGVLLAKLENVFWALLYGLAAVGAWLGRGRRDVIAFPAILTVGVVLAAGLSQANLGTAFRHRGQVLWALVLLAVVGLWGLKTRRREAIEEGTVDPSAG